MNVIIIAAVAENNAIGKDNDLIWSLPADMAFFKEKTRGTTVLTGRKNYESIPEKYRPLPGRENIVITRKKDYSAPGSKVVHSIEEAIEYCKGKDELYVIGGGEIYKLALEKDVVDIMYITEIHGSFDADAFFPEFDKSKWHEEILGEHGIDEKHAYSFTFKIFRRRKN
ncbi:dihydrofolate reductase [Vibrio cincinnatiensis]|uniref:dihydrofolate reductase n=1 Tax=Vibrio cincinnatiensis TaxID=675 RepID=UPI001EDF0796|nr:dihydrofolate reductase [Vibrio cincinnatiensis]MCG3761051.1 dihydrofolate reductase [Vibrio cincinnatiensis]MCG3764370.1 dihydrofolate reductase [Vibrio cincinnatiensis]